MRVTKVTDKGSYTEYHVDEKLRKGSGLSPAGLRLERAFVVGEVGPLHKPYIKDKFFEVNNACPTSEEAFKKLVAEYGDKIASLSFSWIKDDRFENKLEVTTTVAFSSVDEALIGAHDAVYSAARYAGNPSKRMVVACRKNADCETLQEFVKSILL